MLVEEIFPTSNPPGSFSFRTLSNPPDQVIQVGLIHSNQGTDDPIVKCACTNVRHLLTTCVCKESIVIGSDHAFDIHPITREAANLPLHRAGFWVN